VWMISAGQGSASRAAPALDQPASGRRPLVQPPVPDGTEAERRMQREFVGRFSPGRLIYVDTDHCMEPVIPGLLAYRVFER
jgi:hypothetical protein